MKKILKNKSTLFCFTPEVMLLTFVTEMILALYTFIKYRTSKFGRAVVLTLILLATFQIAEFGICRGTNPLIWAKIGFVAITLLPVLGLYLIYLLDRKAHFLRLGYVFAAGFLMFFIFVPNSIQGAACGGNYVIFSGPQGLYMLWGSYYFGFLLLAVWELLDRMLTLSKKEKVKKLFFWFIIGYLSFILPLAVLYFLFESVRGGITSVMCGFAILFALILTFKIIPLYNEISKEK